ncbi:MAG: hypothetical protein LBE55_06580 [Clostridiales bacterium]|nr:hypothetical protein [Clostridiales bacterium]
MLEPAQEKLERYAAELRRSDRRAEKWRKIAVIAMAALAVSTTVLFVREHRFETARQSHLRDLQNNIREFESIMWDFDAPWSSVDDSIDRLRAENGVFRATTRALWNHHDWRIGTIDSEPWEWWAWQELYFVRVDAPEVLRENRADIAIIIWRLVDNIMGEPALDTYDALRLVLAARDEINEFFWEHDFEQQSRYLVERVRSELRRLQDYIYLDIYLASHHGYAATTYEIVLRTLAAFVNHALHNLYAHHGEEFAGAGLDIFMDYPTLLGRLFRYHDNPNEIAWRMAVMLWELREAIDPVMDWRQISGMVAETMDEIQEMYQMCIY